MPHRLRAVALSVGLVLVSAVLAVSTSTPSASGAASEQQRRQGVRPNIVFIVTDDQSLHDLRFMPITKRVLADKGVSFTGLSPHPLCCPARAEILTGQFAQNNGVRSNRGVYGGFKRLDPSSTVATWLHDAGYRTAFMGKFLNGYGGRGLDLAPLPGWDQWDATVGGVYNYRNFAVDHDGVKRTLRGTYQTDYFTDLALRRIGRFAAQQKPFFLWQSYVAPHGSCTPQHELSCWSPPGTARRHRSEFRHLGLSDARKPSFNEADMSDKPSWMQSWQPFTGDRYDRLVQFNRARARALQAVDEGVGRIVQKLRNTGELSHTLIIFTSDNGYLLGEHRYAGKVLAYEESLRVPLLMRGPGVPRGVTVPDVATTVDLAPTAAVAAGATPTLTVDGHDLVAAAQGRTPSWSTLLVQAGSRGPADDRGTGWYFRGVRTSRYTFIRYDNRGEWELYDRARDPYELRNVASDPRYARVRAELARRLALLAGCNGSQDCNQDLGPEPKPLRHK